MTLVETMVRKQNGRPVRPPTESRITRQEYAALVAHLDGQTDTLGVRALAVVRLAHDGVVRLREIPVLDVVDFDASRGTLMLPTYAGERKVPVELPPATVAAVEAWLAARGALRHVARQRPQRVRALFVAVLGSPKRLSHGSVFRIVMGAARAAGVEVSPRDLQLLGVHEALLATGGDILAVAEFARMNPAQLLRHAGGMLRQPSRIAYMVADAGVETKP